MISAQKQTEFFHSGYDSLKRVRSIWICLTGEEEDDSIEEISLDRKAVFGNRKNPYSTDLMKGIIVNIRNRENVETSQNILISMLENLLIQTDIEKKKRITGFHGMPHACLKLWRCYISFPASYVYIYDISFQKIYNMNLIG